MFEAFFGTEMPLALRFFVAFLVVLALIGAAAYLVRRFGVGDRLGATPPRGRQPRLAVIDAANVDARRRLVLIRRDNIEHLLLIGGPTDIVVEPNIVRAQPAAVRETAPARMPAEAHPRSMPAEAVTWPPEPAARANRPVVPDEAIHWPMQPEPMPRADAPMRAEHPQEVAARFEPPVPRPEPAPKPETRRPPATDAFAGLAAEFPRPEKRPEPPIAKPRAVPAPEQPARSPQPAPTPAPAAADQNLAEMAQRLEAALRRPMPPREQRNGDANRGPTVEAKARPNGEEKPAGATEKAAAPESSKNGHAAPAKDAKDAKEGKDTRDTKAAKDSKDAPSEQKPAAKDQEPMTMPPGVFDNLEQEMASLLGRSAGKS